MTYKLIADTTTIYRLSDNASIPADERNEDYKEYLAWVASGGVPFPASYKTPEQLAAEAQETEDDEARQAAKVDNTVRFLVTHTPQECYDKVMTDVTNLAQAKEMIGRIAMALSAGFRKQLR